MIKYIILGIVIGFIVITYNKHKSYEKFKLGDIVIFNQNSFYKNKCSNRGEIYKKAFSQYGIKVIGNSHENCPKTIWLYADEISWSK